MGIFSIFVTAILFLAMIMNLAAKPKHSAQITGGALVFAALSGLILYGYGFAKVMDDFFLSIIRSTLAVCGMFVGKNELSAISSADFIDNRYVKIWFWLAHACALYATASAAITTVGAEALKKLRLALARGGKMILIFGTGEEALSFGSKKIKEKHTSVVFVSGKASAAAATKIHSMGAVLKTDPHALHPDRTFLRSLGMTSPSREIHVYALDADENANITFAKELMAALEKMHHDPQKLSLALPASEEEFGPQFQAGTDHYGYGFINLFDPSDLSARLMIQKCPTWESISFDENGKAEEDFDCVIIGFGRSGQAALKYLAMNGQFEGSHFHAAIFAQGGEVMSGKMQVELQGLFDQYDIEFHNADGRSLAFYKYMKSHADSIRYVAICTGPEEINNEIASEINAFAVSNHMKTAIVQCYHFGIRAQAKPGTPASVFSSYSDDTLSVHTLDEMAMILNHRYLGDTPLTPWKAWIETSHFNRMSCRAATDFFPAFLSAAHVTKEEALSGGFAPEGELLENLSRTEHLRWNAFHLCMGYLPMSDETWQERAKIYTQEKESGKPSIRISKDADKRLHACLVSWEELVTLSEKEAKVTGKTVNYQDMDTQNILAIPELLKLQQTT